MPDDRFDLLEARFRKLLAAWLKSLPAGGWEGTSRQLGNDLAAFSQRHQVYAYVPTCPTRKVELALAGSGFALTNYRTKSERLVRIARLPGRRKAAN